MPSFRRFGQKYPNYTYIHTHNRTIRIQISLIFIYKMLNDKFIRSHRSFIINKEHIVELKLLNNCCYEVIYNQNKKALMNKIKKL
ncbi:LytTR family DNA-binding domain-containing protein [Bacillus sp. CGMCC 1.60114]|uniref:LytTR family DNA-binding domain-containing protein n=1 Tax=unclassified Bacillus (in: firmicutes) TaxID=185979 RepID=UPI00362915A2